MKNGDWLRCPKPAALIESTPYIVRRRVDSVACPHFSTRYSKLPPIRRLFREIEAQVMAEDGIHPGDLIVVIKPAGDSKGMFGELVFERSLALREGDVLRAD